MTVISSQEFAANQQKYFDMAREREEVRIKVENDEGIFVLRIVDIDEKFLETEKNESVC